MGILTSFLPSHIAFHLGITISRSVRFLLESSLKNPHKFLLQEPPFFTSTMISNLLASITIISLPLASSFQPVVRAGGPEAKPIPSNCTLESITLRGPGISVPGPDSYDFINPDLLAADGFGPNDDFRDAQTTYSYFLTDESNQPGWNESAHVQQCLEQCYGYGEVCSGVAWGHNVTGYIEGQMVHGLGCLFFKEPVQKGNLVSVVNGSWTGTLAVNIVCE